MGDGPAVGRVRAYVGLGANLGDTAGTLAAAVHALGTLPGASLAGVSRLYATAPVGLVDQPEFRNAVVALDVPAGARRGDRGVRAARRAQGHRARVRAAGARALGSARGRPRRPPVRRRARSRSSVRRRVAATTRPRLTLPLTVPHAEARNRLFVLAPLADLAPDLVPPGWGETVGEAAARRRAEEGEDGGPPGRDLGRRGLAAARAVGLEADGRRPVPIEHVDRVHEPDLLALVRHHERVRPGAAAEEPDALEQLARASPRWPRTRAGRPTPGPRSGRRGPRRRGRASSTPSRARVPRRCGTGTGPGSRRPGSAARPR